MGRLARSAATELYTRPNPDRKTARRESFSSDGFEIEAENPAQNKNVGNIV